MSAPQAAPTSYRRTSRASSDAVTASSKAPAIRSAAERVQALLDRLRVVAGLVQVFRVDACEGRAAGELRPALEQRDRLLLDRVRVGEVLPQLLGEVVAADLAERRVDGAVEGALEPLHHRALLGGDPLD